MKIAEIRLARWPGVASALRTRNEPRNRHFCLPISQLYRSPARKRPPISSRPRQAIITAAATRAVRPIVVVARHRPRANLDRQQCARSQCGKRKSAGAAPEASSSRQNTSPAKRAQSEDRSRLGPTPRRASADSVLVIVLSIWRPGCRRSGASQGETFGVPGLDGLRAASGSLEALAAKMRREHGHQTRCVGAGAYCTNALAPSPPTAKPHNGPAFVKTGARPLPSGCRSISVAPSALVARPTATPCTARATNSCATPSAIREQGTNDAFLNSAALQSTRRRPEWSAPTERSEEGSRRNKV